MFLIISMMSETSPKSIAKAAVLLLVVYCHFNFSFSDIMKENQAESTKIYFYYNNPLHLSRYRVVEGSLTGVQKAFDNHSHDVIKKGEEFTVLVDFSSPLYNQERQWFEIPARFCYGRDTEACVNQKRALDTPYLVRPSSVREIPVPFVVPFSKLYRATLPNTKTVIVSGVVHKQFKTFEVNGAKYDTSTGILVKFKAESSALAGKISGIDFLRDTRKHLNQPLIQCQYVEWTADGCVPGLNNLMYGYNVKQMELRGRPWLKAVKFPKHKDDKYLQNLDILGIGPKNYIVFKDMFLEKVSKIENPFAYLFASVEEQVNTTLKSVEFGQYGKEKLSGSGKYESFSKHYEEQSYSAAMSGTEFRFFRATMSKPYLEDEANWNDAFKTTWNELFDQSNKEKAMDFFGHYGTHYVVQAVMGGRQESVFTVDYCKVGQEKKTKLAFEAELLKPYKFYTSSSVGIQAHYMKSNSLSKIIISGPLTTCIGGKSLDVAVCDNLTLWRSSVLNNPYPIRMTLKPFYTLVKGYLDGLWLKKMYEDYLKAGLDEAKITSDIKSKPTCEKKPTSTLSDIAIVSIAVPSILVVGVIFKFRNRIRQNLASHTGQ